jgi:hypothetical protein
MHSRTYLTLAVVLLLGLLGTSHVSAARLNTTIVKTDTLDYAPGDSVIITGSGYWPGETVTVSVVNFYNPGIGDNRPPWDIVADPAGNFETFWIVPSDGVDQTYLVTASGQSSGIEATTTFTDCNTILEFVSGLPDSLCGGSHVDVCAFLAQNCGNSKSAALPGRKVLFFINSGNCGVDVGQHANDSALTDSAGLACGHLTIPSTPGQYSIRIKFLGEKKPKSSEPANGACSANERVELSATNQCQAFRVGNPGTTGSAPVVTLPPNQTVTQCAAGPICLPVLVDDPNCDVVSVTSNIGTYGGTQAGFDQIARLKQLGGTITQIGGGQNGKVLTSSADFVAPVNATSGVSVTLPNFIFASTIVNYGSFPSGVGPAQSADQLKGAPTSLTFTLPGAGGPDNGLGDGSVDFLTGNSCTIGFPQLVTTCDGSSVDFVVFSTTNGGGTAQIIFKNNGYNVYSVTRVIPGGASGSGSGGVNFDLPDGLTFNQVFVKCTSGDVRIDAFAARTAPSSSTKDICFTPDTSGVYTVTVTATDRCGHVGIATSLVTVHLNHPPVANAGADFSKFLCASAPICFNVTFSDPDNNLMTKQLIAGPGTLTGNQICFTPSAPGTSTFIIKATDSCGLSSQDTVNVIVSFNNPPVAVNPSPVTKFLCSAGQQCYQFTATDPNGGTLTWTKLAGTGTITSAGQFCFTPTTSGTYSASVIVSDSCGAKDTTSISYSITINAVPVATDPVSPVNLTQCTAQQVCYQFAATDPNGGTLTWSKLSGAGTVSSTGQWCFTPTTTGSYSATVKVADSCGLADTTTLNYNVTVNGAPTVAFGNDTTLALCAPQQICLSYQVSDPQGLSGITEAMVSGYGTIDTANNKICFTPTTAGTYQFIVRASDQCAASDVDTIVAHVSFGTAADIVCPASPINVSLCAAGTVCQTLTITPSSATVTTSLGTYSGGQLCFTAATSGTYTARVIASTSCSADTCNLTFNVTIGQTAQITCPPPQSKLICQAGNICVPVGVVGQGATVTVTPIGAYSAGNVCFTADTTGHYVLKVKATSSCGSDSCNVVVNVAINSAPIAVNSPTPVDTFMCAPAQICRQFSATDPNGGTLTWTRLSGSGSVSTGGQWCFTPNASGSYAVLAKVSDSCGAADTVSLAYNVTINGAPHVALGNDTSIFICASAQVCLPFTLTDPDNGTPGAAIISGTGQLLTNPDRLCFTPTAAGVYQFIVEASDACGAKDYDTINVTIRVNRAPVVNAGANQTVFQCQPGPICWPAAATDPDGNLKSVQLVNSPGTFNGSEICFTPTGTLNYEFVLKATDSCGVESFDTVVVYYTLNSAPVANAGLDQTIFQCTPAQIAWPASCSDVNGNLTDCRLIAGPGSYNGSQISFTPAASGSYSFILQAADACGLTDLDTSVVHVTVNSAPVCVVPHDTTIFQCTAAQVCLPVSGADVDNNLRSVEIVSGPGTLNNGTWCYTPLSSQYVTVTVRATDNCNATSESTFHVQFNVNHPPTIAFSSQQQQFLCSSEQVCIDYTDSDPDAPRPTTVSLVSGSGTLDTLNHRVCFTAATPGTYTFIIRIQDECGAFDQDTAHVVVSMNHPPVANAGLDQIITQCTPTQICWPASCTDADNNLVSCDFSGPGTYDGANICFTPAATGIYEFTLTATDACGATMTDTVRINVTINSAPHVAFGNDTTLSLCAVQQICMNYTVSDPNGPGGLAEVMVSGYGSIDTAANKVCFTPTVSGSYQFIVQVTDGCGAYDRDTIVANVTVGQPAHIDRNYPPISTFLCAAGSVCQPLTITPPSATVSVSYGTYNSGQLCFNVDTSGTYRIKVIAATSCRADTIELVRNMVIDRAPVADAGPDQTVFQCAPSQVCWPVSCSDPDGNLTNCAFTGPGTYNGSSICFTPAGSGIYLFTLTATDACGKTMTDTARITVTSNLPPTVAFGNDTTLSLCDPQQVCLSYTVGDPNGLAGVTEHMVSGFGTIDTATNKVCFSPSASGDYQFIVEVTDQCGASARDTIVAHVTINQRADIVCPSGPIATTLCAPGQVCQQLTITPASATVTTSFGTYSGGTLCFTADTTGTYHIRVIASNSCGADTCQLTFNVNIGGAPQLTCPAPQDKLICQTGSICVPVGVVGQNATVTVTPFGSYSNGDVCFPADSSGHYVLKIKATTACGADSCSLVVNVVVNSRPVALDPPQTPKDTFACVTGQVCYQFGANDPNPGPLYWSKLSGVGTVTTGGLWCFTPGTSGSYGVTVVVADSCCGAADTTSLTYNVTVNNPPEIAFGNDTTFAVCGSAPICLPYTVTDPNNNVVLEQLISGPGTIDTLANKVCFTPSSGVHTFIIKAQDACGAADYDTINVSVTLGTAPQVSRPQPQTKFLCATGSICVPVTVTPSGATVTVSPIGTYSAGNLCFTADTSGHYVIKIKAASGCGADSANVVVDVTINSRPIAVDPTTPKDTFVCAPAEICYQFSANDPNGGQLAWTKILGCGAVVNGRWCFTPTTSGQYSVTVAVADSCGAADTTTLTYNITVNAPPVLTITSPKALRILCQGSPICFDYAATDPNNNLATEELISGPGTIDTALNRVCFTPSAAGTYTFILRATDHCGAFDQDTINVTVNLNRPPVVNAGPDQTLFRCGPTEICWPASASDPDNNLDSVKVISGPGTFTGSSICFTPTANGVYHIILQAKDKCGEVALDTVNITIQLNAPPVCNIPTGTHTYFQCVPNQVSLPVTGTDPDNNFDHCEILSGPGSIVAGNWVYTPSVDEYRKVVIQCVDQCGASCKDSFFVRFNINAAPVVNAGPDKSYFVCRDTTICWNVTATDEDNNLKSVELISPIGSYNANAHQICFPVTYADGPTTQFMFVLKATDSCGATSFDTTFATIDFNNKPAISAPPDFTAYLDMVGQLCFDVTVADADNNLGNVTVSPVGAYNAGAHQVCFNADTTGTYCLVIRAADACGAVAFDTVCIQVVVDQCIHVQIENLKNVHQGLPATINLYLNGSGKQLGGYDFMIAYDPTVLTPQTVTPGQLYTQCGWEYFTFRHGANGNCGSGCPSGLLHIVAMAETNNGAYHPGCFFDGQLGSLAAMDFIVSSDRALNCQFTPINFFWTNCDDNALSSKHGDTMWVERKVFDAELRNITDHSHGVPGYFGIPDHCLANEPGKPTPQRCIDFTNGGINIICSDSIDARGDLNQNGFAYEIADAVMFTNYFIIGLPAFMPFPEGAIAASDVNADGIPLTVADLVYLIRVIVGDAAMMPKPVPGQEPTAEFSVTNGTLTVTKADAPIGALYVLLEGDVHPTLHEGARGMEIRSGFDGKNTRVLIYSMNGKAFLNAGPVLELGDARAVKSVDAGSYDGRVMKTSVASLPLQYELSQNYPNPFNPVTTIQFALPVAGEWKLAVYNVLGQEVTNWTGKSEAGYYKMEWDAGKLSSGVYFYRLTAGTYSATRKMVLLK